MRGASPPRLQLVRTAFVRSPRSRGISRRYDCVVSNIQSSNARIPHKQQLEPLVYHVACYSTPPARHYRYGEAQVCLCDFASREGPPLASPASACMCMFLCHDGSPRPTAQRLGAASAMEQTADLEHHGPTAQVAACVVVPSLIAFPLNRICDGCFSALPRPHGNAVAMPGLSRRHRMMPAAACQAADVFQPERLRDGSLLYRFASGHDAADGRVTSSRSFQGHDAAAMQEPSGNHKDASHNGHGGTPVAVPSNGQISSGDRRDKGARPASNRAGGRTAPSGRSAAEGGGERTARASADARQLSASQRDGAGVSPASTQRWAPAQQQGSAATVLNATAMEHSARGTAAEPRPSFMDIPPPQQQYRTMMMTAPRAGGSDSSGEEDDVAARLSSRSGWSSKRRPQRVRTDRHHQKQT